MPDDNTVKRRKPPTPEALGYLIKPVTTPEAAPSAATATSTPAAAPAKPAVQSVEWSPLRIGQRDAFRSMPRSGEFTLQLDRAIGDEAVPQLDFPIVINVDPQNAYGMQQKAKMQDVLVWSKDPDPDEWKRLLNKGLGFLNSPLGTAAITTGANLNDLGYPFGVPITDNFGYRFAFYSPFIVGAEVAVPGLGFFTLNGTWNEVITKDTPLVTQYARHYDDLLVALDKPVENPDQLSLQLAESSFEFKRPETSIFITQGISIGSGEFAFGITKGWYVVPQPYPIERDLLRLNTPAFTLNDAKLLNPYVTRPFDQGHNEDYLSFDVQWRSRFNQFFLGSGVDFNHRQLPESTIFPNGEGFDATYYKLLNFGTSFGGGQ